MKAATAPLIAAVITLSLFALTAVTHAAEEPAELTFSWTKNTDPVDGYAIYRDASQPNQYVFPDFPQDSTCDNTGKCTGIVPNIADGKNHRYNAVAYKVIDGVRHESDFSVPADVLITQEKTPQEPVTQTPQIPSPKTFIFQGTLQEVVQ